MSFGRFRERPGFGPAALAALVVLLMAGALFLGSRWRAAQPSAVAEAGRILREVRAGERRDSPLFAPLVWLEEWPPPFPTVAGWILGPDDGRAWDAAERLAALGHGVFPRLQRALRRDRSIAVRRVAAEALAELDAGRALPDLAAALAGDRAEDVRRAVAFALYPAGPAAVPALVQALQADAESSVRAAAARSLGYLDGGSDEPAALATLLAALAGDPESDVRAAAAGALESFEDAAVGLALRRALAHDASAEVREGAASALAAHPVPEVLEALREALAQGGDAAVRRAAAVSLGRLRDAGALSLLSDAVEADPQFSVRITAASALGRIGDARAFPALSNALTAPVAASAAPLSGRAPGFTPRPRDEADLRRAAAKALAQAGGTNAIPVLLAALAGESEGFVRSDIMSVLADLGGEAVQRALVARLEEAAGRGRDSEAATRLLARLASPELAPLMISLLDPARADEGVRAAAALALGRPASPEAASALMKVLHEDPEEDVRRAAAEALGRSRDAHAGPALTAALDDRSPSVVAAAALALGRLGHTAAVPAITNLFSRFPPDEEDRGTARRGEVSVRDSAATALGLLGDPCAVPALLAASAAEQDPSAQAVLLRALGRIGGEAAREALVPALASRMPEIRTAAAVALGEMGGLAAAALLEQALPRLTGREPRVSAVLALGFAGEATAVPTLSRLLAADPDHEVRAAAARALRLLGEPASRPALAAALNDPQADVRQQAAWALGALGALGDPAAEPALVRALGDRTADVAFAAGFALVQARVTSAGPALVPLLADRRPRPRLAAAGALVMLGDGTGRERLREALQAENDWERFIALVSLARGGTPADVALLRGHAGESVPELRRLADSLGRGEDGQALAALLNHDRYGQYAAEALLFFPDQAVLPALRAAGRNDDESVRESARVAARRIERTLLAAGTVQP